MNRMESLPKELAEVVALSKQPPDKALALRKCSVDSKFRMSSCQEEKAGKVFSAYS